MSIAEKIDAKAVENFAAALKNKMDDKRFQGRYGWDDPDHCSTHHLCTLLIEQILTGDPIDIGNYAMMLHNRADYQPQDMTEALKRKLLEIFGL